MLNNYCSDSTARVRSVLANVQPIHAVDFIVYLIELFASSRVAESCSPAVAVICLIAVEKAALICVANADAIVVSYRGILLASIVITEHTILSAVISILERVTRTVVNQRADEQRSASFPLVIRATRISLNLHCGVLITNARECIVHCKRTEPQHSVARFPVATLERITVASFDIHSVARISRCATGRTNDVNLVEGRCVGVVSYALCTAVEHHSLSKAVDVDVVESSTAVVTRAVQIQASLLRSATGNVVTVDVDVVQTYLLRPIEAERVYSRSSTQRVDVQVISVEACRVRILRRVAYLPSISCAACVDPHRAACSTACIRAALIRATVNAYVTYSHWHDKLRRRSHS